MHPATGRVLLRWHQRQQAWLQVGGHGDPGRERPARDRAAGGREETGLADLVPWPDAALLQVAVVDVPARRDEPDHQHADLRFLLATGDPEAARPENPEAPLRWLTVPEARRGDHGRQCPRPAGPRGPAARGTGSAGLALGRNGITPAGYRIKIG